MKSPNFIITIVIMMIAMCSTCVHAQYTETTLSNGTKKGYLKGYKPQGQQQDYWCWATSGSMTMTYVNASTAPDQCTQAAARFSSDCCDSGTASGSSCNKGGWPNFEAYGYSKQKTADGTPLTFEQIKATLKSNSPICYVWWWAGGGGHMMTAFGWAESTNGQQWVLIADPLPARSSRGTVKCITYEAYVSRAGRYTHGPDFYNITR